MTNHSQPPPMGPQDFAPDFIPINKKVEKSHTKIVTFKTPHQGDFNNLNLYERNPMGQLNCIRYLRVIYAKNIVYITIAEVHGGNRNSQ